MSNAAGRLTDIDINYNYVYIPQYLPSGEMSEKK